MHAAAFNENPDIARLLIAAGAEVNVQTYLDKYTPLHTAAEDNSNPEVIRVLIAAGANVDAQDYDGFVPLQLAIPYNDNPAIALAFIQGGANVNIPDNFGNSILHRTVTYNDSMRDLLEALLNAGANVNARTNLDHTPLHYAAGHNAGTGVITILIERGATVDPRDHGGFTPLHHAATFNKQTSIGQTLLDAGVVVDARSDRGTTPLGLATWNDNPAVARVLLDAGADPASDDNRPTDRPITLPKVPTDVTAQGPLRGVGDSWDPSRGLISGTAFFDADIVIATDRSTYEEIRFVGRETRYVFDRRVGDDDSRESGMYHDQHDTYVFDASYEDLPGFEALGRSLGVVEVLVNPEFGMDEAEQLAEHYARLLGQLPAMLRSGVDELVIHDGDNAWGGGAKYIVIHKDHLLEDAEFVEEILMHETVHSVLDFFAETYRDPRWREAAMEDGGFASEYAEDHPSREDVAESYVAWFAVRYRSDRMTPALTSWIESAISQRLEYFDARLAAGDRGFAPGMCPVVEENCPTVAH